MPLAGACEGPLFRLRIEATLTDREVRLPRPSRARQACSLVSGPFVDRAGRRGASGPALRSLAGPGSTQAGGGGDISSSSPTGSPAGRGHTPAVVLYLALCGRRIGAESGCSPRLRRMACKRRKRADGRVGRATLPKLLRDNLGETENLSGMVQGPLRISVSLSRLPDRLPSVTAMSGLSSNEPFMIAKIGHWQR